MNEFVIEALTCSDIRASYGAFVVLEGVTFSVGRGDVVGIAGPNGAGKSTLFDVFTGRVKADHGRIQLMDQDVTRLPTYQRSRLGLARTFQAPLVPVRLTVGETLAAAQAAYTPIIEQSEVEATREIIGFRGENDRLSGELDTLDRRRLLLCCLLLRKPKVLLLDEPCSGLETREIDEMQVMIERINALIGLAVVVVEHRLEFLHSVSNRVTVLHEGRTIAEGAPADVFMEPVVREAYFEAPRVG